MNPFSPNTAYAADDYLNEALGSIKVEILYPVVTLLFALALFYFLWGVVKFIWSEEDSDERKKGRIHMLWGVVGMAIMFSAIAIVAFVYRSVVDIGGDTGYGGSPIPTPSVIIDRSL